MSKFEMIHFARLINEYFERNVFKFYAIVEDGGVAVYYLVQDGLKWKIDFEKKFFKYYSYGNIIGEFADIIIDDFLTNLGLEIKLEMLGSKYGD